MRPISVDILKQIESSSISFVEDFNLQINTKKGLSFKEYTKQNGINIAETYKRPQVDKNGNITGYVEQDTPENRTYVQQKASDIAEWINSKRSMLGIQFSNHSTETQDIEELDIEKEYPVDDGINTELDKEYYLSNSNREEEAREIFFLGKNGYFYNGNIKQSSDFKFTRGTKTAEDHIAEDKNDLAYKVSGYQNKMLSLYVAADKLNKNRSIFSKLFNWGLSYRISKAKADIKATLTKSEPKIFTEKEFDAITDKLLDKNPNKYNGMKGFDSNGKIEKGNTNSKEDYPATQQELSAKIYKEFQTNDHQKLVEFIKNNPKLAKDKMDIVEADYLKSNPNQKKVSEPIHSVKD